MTNRDNFIIAASVPRKGDHTGGTLSEARAMLAADATIAAVGARANIYLAAVLGDDAAVRDLLALDAENATRKGGPFHWDALTYLCFSRFLRLDDTRSDALVRSATALLDAGANPNTGYNETDNGAPMFEAAIYGAAGLAHHAGLTRLLLERGADPNDDETPYHTPETYDNRAMEALVESGKLTADSMTSLLVRKADWHDTEGMRYLLEHGADPNSLSRWKVTPLQQAVRRDNDIAKIALMLDHGGDLSITKDIHFANAFRIAARRGRADILAEAARRGVAEQFSGLDALIAACAVNNGDAARAMVAARPDMVPVLQREGGTLLSEFAGNRNVDGVRLLLDLGVPVTARYASGDGYFDIAPMSLAIHVAAWKAAHEVVALLIERGSPVNDIDGRGRTPLMLAVRACVDSYWMDRRKPDSVEVLLGAGASRASITVPTGYNEIDVWLSD